MTQIGLALSGGGFRATLYHLGLVRFLRDAKILPNVTQITSVSGGSILAAHLVLNWDRYNGSPSEFDAAAGELLAFVTLDVRNRILRRFPLGLTVRWMRRLAGFSNRQLTRPGLLEYHYQKFLFGETSLFELPEKPRLHILATNLSEGCLCSFNRDGLLVMRRGSNGDGIRVDHARASLATVPMAVAASSAFPGFFPPLELTEAEVGTPAGDFGRQAFTDGGVFDNLGIRMFHYLKEFLGPEHANLDGVLISDVGKPIAIQQDQGAGGLVRTSLRASDILMDRVWQLETETFRGTPGFVFARVVEVVEPCEDPTALHPELQRRLPTMRTDLDRFSPLEIRSLVRHGYCVGRKVCRTRPDLFGSDLPACAPWDPFPEKLPPPAPDKSSDPAAAGADIVERPHRVRAVVTNEARALQKSGRRRIWSTLLDYRDWTSYIYVPLLVPILIIAPWLSVRMYRHAQRVDQIVESLTQSSRDLEQMSRLIQGPEPRWTGQVARAIADTATTHDNTGFTILQDLRIIDLRKWKPGRTAGDQAYLYGYRRLKILRAKEDTANNLFTISVLAISPNTKVRFPAQLLVPTLLSRPVQSSGDSVKRVKWLVQGDFRRIPPGQSVDLVYEHESPGLFVQEGSGTATLAFDVEVETVELTRWLLLPTAKQFRDYRLIRYETGKPESAEDVSVVTRYLSKDYSVLAFKMLALKPGYTYELTWFYR
ncbi:MAG TPA: patatin-like phospholipase family protein [Gemmatimonadaceae bacterium]